MGLADHLNAAAASGIRSRSFRALALLAVLGTLVLPGSAEPRAARGLAEVTLQVAAMPTGALNLSEQGTDASTGDPINRCPYDYPDGECRVVYSVGSAPLAVTLTPDPGPGQSFHGWSTPDCGGGPTCTVTLSESSEPSQVWAIFDPAHLTVLIGGDTGAGTVTGAGGKIKCDSNGQEGSGDCVEDLPVGTKLELTATPEPGKAVRWVFGCDPGDDASASGCVARAENRFVGVIFGDADAPAPPFFVQVRFRVTKAGSGAGSIAGGSIDCGSACVSTLQFGERLKLTATPATGSRFDRWVGAPCSAEPTCTLNAGPITSVRAVFEALPSQPPPPPPPPPPPFPPTPGPPPSQPKLEGRLLAVTSRRVAGRYRVFARLEVSKQVNARLRVARGGTIFGQRTIVIRRGRTKAWVPLARITRPGRYWLVIRLRASNGQVLTIPPRRFAVGR